MDNCLTPKITVLMPVYNCELYIKEAVESILNQTYTNFEFIIIDDCSTDTTLQICKSFQDERIVIIEKEKNSGYTNSLNYGLSIAKGKYIARMDGDDISLPERFEKQVGFMEANEDVVLCGTSLKVIDSNKIISYSQHHDFIKLEMLKRNCIIHPSVMIKRAVLEFHSLKYDVSKEPAEDYNLWTKLLLYGKLYNFQEVLIHYRVHDLQVSQRRIEKQIESSIKTQMELLNNLNIEESEQLENFLMKIFKNKNYFSFREIIFFSKIKESLLVANLNLFFEPIGFKDYLNEIENKLVKNYFFKRSKYSPKIVIDYLLIRNKVNFKTTIILEFKLFIKSILFWNVK